MQITAGTPSGFAASATPCAWLPDEKASTPRRLASTGSWLIVLYAPRNLKAPPRWKLSHLRKTSRPASSFSVREVITGVTFATPRSRSRAASTSSNVTRSLISLLARRPFDQRIRAHRERRAAGDARGDRAEAEA